MKRRSSFAIRTDHMPDRVYRFLETKAINKELKDYLIELVERDLNGSLPDYNLHGSIEEMKDEMAHQFKLLTKILNEKTLISSEKHSPKEYNHEEELTEGQIITSDKIKGAIEEAYDIDF